VNRWSLPCLTQDRGQHRLKYSLCPHAGSWSKAEVVRHARFSAVQHSEGRKSFSACVLSTTRSLTIFIKLQLSAPTLANS
jgi:alpha-mannosidase